MSERETPGDRSEGAVADATRFPAVAACFVLSGFAGLVYETAWTRQFAFVFGTSELAVSTVLGAYMGGLALGAAVASRWVARIRRPVATYGVLELGIAALALAIPFLIHATMRLHVRLFAHADGRLEEAGVASAIFYLIASFAILAVPTGFMGATLPLLARHAVRSEAQLGRRIGVLYGANTAGAVLGTLAAGFVLLPVLGLDATIRVAAAANAVVFALAVWIARGAAEPGAEAAGDRAPSRTGLHWILPAILISGAASFVYEVLWTRLLVHLLGGSIYAFATMLASFLVGITLGAALAGRRAPDARAAVRGFAWAEALAAALAGVAYAAIGRSPDAARWLAEAGASRLLTDAAIAGAILLPGAIAIGATFPLAVRILARRAPDAGPASARVYAWNTIGAVIGSVGAGFVVIPVLGYGGAFALAATANLGLAAWAAWQAGGRTRVLAPVAALAAGALLLSPPATPWRLISTSALTRAQPQRAQGEVTYHGIGRSSAVLLLDWMGEWQLLTNGLPESDIQPHGARLARAEGVLWLGALPALLRPPGTPVLVVGLGGGRVIEGMPRGTGPIDVVELERDVVAANAVVAGERSYDPLSDPNVRVHVNDARNALLLTRQSYGAIVSQPSHPWTAGASHLYTVEFFELVRARLAPGGVFVQWIGAPFLDPPLLRSLAASLLHVFPHVRIYEPRGRPMLLFVASGDALPDADGVADRIAPVSEQLAAIGLRDGADVDAARVVDEDGVRALGAGAPLNRDGHNRLQSRAPLLLEIPVEQRRRAIAETIAPFDPAPALARRHGSMRLVRALLEQGATARAARLAESLPPGPTANAAHGLVALARGRIAEAMELLHAAAPALGRDPEVRAGLLRAAALAAATLADPPVAPPLSAAEAACWQGWRLERAGRLEALAALEPQLAAVPVAHPLGAAAARLRARWRIEQDDPERAEEALALLDSAIAAGRRAGDPVVRARLALRAGHLRATIADLDEWTRLRGRTAPRARVRLDREARSVLRALPRTAPYDAWIPVLEQRLAASVTPGR